MRDAPGPGMKTLQTITALGITAVIAAIGCSHEPTTPVGGTQAPTGVMSQQNQADRDVAYQLAGARCDHEQSCNNVGPGKKYASRQSCMDQLTASTFDDLNAYNCPKGIDRASLSHCMQSIQSRDCGFSLSALTGSDQCGSGSLCLK
jgi:hypothetical protein